jgi:hypothetical protein
VRVPEHGEPHKQQAHDDDGPAFHGDLLPHGLIGWCRGSRHVSDLSGTRLERVVHSM